MDSEEWHAIDGYDGGYEVSSFGRVRSRVRSWVNPKVMSPSADGDGYPQLMLVAYRGVGRRRTVKVHRLVAAVFLGPIPPGMTVNHKDGNRRNNRVDNLELCTNAENVYHSIDMLDRRYDGTHNPAAKLTEEQVVTIRERAARGETFVAIAADFEVTPPMVRMIATGKAWDLVGGPRIAQRVRRSVRALAPEAVTDIRDRHAAGERAADLAAEFGVTPTTVHNHLRAARHE